LLTDFADYMAEVSTRFESYSVRYFIVVWINTYLENEYWFDEAEGDAFGAFDQDQWTRSGNLFSLVNWVD
jgi:hypothetical protein